jgi:hypothetical protein
MHVQRKARSRILHKLGLLGMVVLSLTAAVSLEYDELFGPLPSAGGRSETLSGNVVVHVVPVPTSSERIVALLVDTEGAGGEPDGVADRLIRFQTLSPDALPSGTFERAVIEYEAVGRLALRREGASEPFATFVLDALLWRRGHGLVVEGFGLSNVHLGDAKWPMDVRELTPEQRSSLVETCPDEPEGSPQACTCYHPLGGSCSVSGCQVGPGGAPSCGISGCDPDASCAWCQPEFGACCRCVTRIDN